MGKNVEVSPKKRAVVVALHKEGFSYRQVQNRTGISLGCVGETIKHYNETA